MYGFSHMLPRLTVNTSELINLFRTLYYQVSCKIRPASLVYLISPRAVILYKITSVPSFTLNLARYGDIDESVSGPF